MNGELKDATVYKIDGSNYFKIRDLAAVLNGTTPKADFAPFPTDHIAPDLGELTEWLGV